MAQQRATDDATQQLKDNDLDPLSSDVPLEDKKVDTITETPPLTVKNTVKYIKGLKYPLGEFFGELLELSDAQLAKLTRQPFQTVDEEFKAYILEWIEPSTSDRGGDNKEGEEEEREEPEWRRLVWALDMIEVVQADDIRQFAEPHKDPTFTVDNLTDVYNLCPLLEEDWGNLWSEWRLSLPPSQFLDVNSLPTMREKNREAAKYVVNINPNSSWTEVAKDLYDFNQLAALDELAKFLPKKESSLSIENLSEVMEGIEGDWTKVWGHTGIGMAVSSIEDEINTSDKKKIAETCAAFYIKYDPDASWKNVAEGLSKQGEKAVLEKVQKYLKK